MLRKPPRSHVQLVGGPVVFPEGLHISSGLGTPGVPQEVRCRGDGGLGYITTPAAAVTMVRVLPEVGSVVGPL